MGLPVPFEGISGQVLSVPCPLGWMEGGRRMDCSVLRFRIQLCFISCGFSAVLLCSAVMNECIRVYSYTE